jgi:uncharacterized protein
VSSIESRLFRLTDPDDPRRIIRGRIDAPTEGTTHGSKRPIAILLHGFKGFMDWGFFPDMARRIASRGFVAVRFNASGSGIGEDLESFTDADAFARNTLSREIEDLGRVRHWIRRGGVEGVDTERTSLVGHSRGGGLALVHAAEARDCRCVVAWAAVSTFDRFDEPTKSIWRQRGFLPILNARTGQELRLGVSALEDLEAHRERFDVPRACAIVQNPALLLHGTADESVPFAESEILLSSFAPGRAARIPIEGAGHTFGVRHPMTESTKAWERVASATLDVLLEKG